MISARAAAATCWLALTSCQTDDSKPGLPGETIDDSTDTTEESDVDDTPFEEPGGDTVTPGGPAWVSGCSFQLFCGQELQAGTTFAHEVFFQSYDNRDFSEAEVQVAIQSVADYGAGVPPAFVAEALNEAWTHGLLQVPNTLGEWAVQFRARGSADQPWRECNNASGSSPSCLDRWSADLAYNGTWVEIVDHPVDTDVIHPFDTDPPIDTDLPVPVDTGPVDSGECLGDTSCP